MNVGPFEFTNTVSGIVFGGLLIVVAGLAWLAREIYKVRSEQAVAKDAAADAKTAAVEAATNTKNVSNGFAGKVTTKLDTLIRKTDQNTEALDAVQRQLTDHLIWHQQQEGNRNG